jgi:hypothetical protein
MTLKEIEEKLAAKLDSIENPVEEIEEAFNKASAWLEMQINKLIKEENGN